MPPTSNFDEGYLPTTSRFLSAGSTSAPRKSPSRQSLSLHPRRSTASLRASNLSQALDDDAANGRHSLAHELAVALMPEPSAGSKLLAEEFGIEYDEGAEGIDETPQEHDSSGTEAPSLADEFGDVQDGREQESPSFDGHIPQDVDPTFDRPVASPKQRKPPEQDPMVILAQDLEYTEKFLSQLRRLDIDHGPSPTQPTMEKLASDMIRHIDDSARNREGQVRELLECEREFRRLAGELGGTEALSQLDELENLIDESSQGTEAARDLSAIQEESLSGSTLANDWEVESDRERLGDDDDEYDSAYSPTPVKSTFPPPPPLTGPPTPANAIPQLAYLRTFTSSAVTSLAVISEHTQVNAAATTEAGRKIRALKNKIGGWRTEWDSAERSRVKIERWEAGLELDGTSSPSATPRPHVTRRIDGRKLVQEHLQAFEKALHEANIKTQAIMAGAS